MAALWVWAVDGTFSMTAFAAVASWFTFSTTHAASANHSSTSRFTMALPSSPEGKYELFPINDGP